MSEKERQRIKDIIVGMRKREMEQHDYGLFMSPSQVRATTLVDVLIATGLADDDMVAERAAQDEAIRDMFSSMFRPTPAPATVGAPHRED